MVGQRMETQKQRLVFLQILSIPSCHPMYVVFVHITGILQICFDTRVTVTFHSVIIFTIILKCIVLLQILST